MRDEQEGGNRNRAVRSDRQSPQYSRARRLLQARAQGGHLQPHQHSLGKSQGNIEQIKTLGENLYKPSFIINSTVEDKRKAVAEARTEITDNKIGELYDTSLSVKENQEVLNSYGVSVSLSRLYKWTSEHNINTKKEIEVAYNPNLSIRQNMQAMNCTMYQVLKAKKNFEKH